MLKLWRNQSNSGKALVALIYMLILIVSTVIIFMIIKYSFNRICNTKKCVDLSNDIIGNIDFTVEPCNNFYSFACGNYEKRYRNSETDHLVIASMLMKFVNDTMDILEDKENKEIYRKSRLTNLARTFYSGCIKNVTNDDYYDKILVAYIDKFGGFPMIEGDKWNEKNWTWMNMIKELRNHGFEYSYLFDFNVWVTRKKNQTRILRIATPLLRVYTENDKDFILTSLIGLIKDLYEVDEKIFIDELEDTIDFHMKISKMTRISDIERTINFGLLKEKVPDINWKSLIKIIVHKDFKIKNSQLVEVHNLNYLKSLGNVLKSTSKRTLANYMVYKTILRTVPIINMLLKTNERDIECVEYLMDQLPVTIMAAYTTKHEDMKEKIEAAAMFKNIADVFENTLRTSKWLNENIKERLIRKLNKMSIIFGLAFGTQKFDEKNFDNFYPNITVNQNDMLTTILNIRKSKQDFDFKQLIRSTDNFLFNHMRISLAFYLSLQNSIYFAPYIPNDKIFDTEYPKSVNYGKLGFIYMHETAHAFAKDYHDRNEYDEIIEWDDESFEKFKDKIMCLYRQYGNYTDPTTNLKIDGSLTLEENFADNQGIDSGYKAYIKWLRKNNDYTLPGLKYNSRQLFWISFAQQWCASMTNATIVRRLVSDPHALPRFRVIGSVSNQKAFAKDFYCEIGSPMNPKNKCETY